MYRSLHQRDNRIFHSFPMRATMRSLLLALIVGTVAASDDLSLGITNYKCSGGGWSVTDFQYSCNGDNGDCGFGNKLTATGTIDISQAFTDQRKHNSKSWSLGVMDSVNAGRIAKFSEHLRFPDSIWWHLRGRGYIYIFSSRWPFPITIGFSQFST